MVLIVSERRVYDKGSNGLTCKGLCDLGGLRFLDLLEVLGIRDLRVSGVWVAQFTASGSGVRTPV